ncbi:MAG TPA: YciI family protein [Solirubrobacteraceae bacterium]|jgi:hypothetical protein|nr:YciI family protein [Solirubrobacteraceae bacterium]
MKFLQLVCFEREATDEENATMGREIFPWVDDTVSRGINITGKPLDDPASARTVRVRDGETLISDGPFADTKEFIAGFDLIDCESLEQAIEVAAAHPVAWFNAIELRRLRDDDAVPHEIDHAQLQQMLLVCVDGVAAEPAVEAQIWRDCQAWRTEIESSGVHIAGAAVAPAGEAKTVRRRDGETLVSDGPFLETKEFVGGFDLLGCASLEEAVGWAAKHPIARYHQIEVRNFRDLRDVSAEA